jgi:polar amino acid transport system substrate-binding protein
VFKKINWIVVSLILSFSANSIASKKLTFALQPHDAHRFHQNLLENNIALVLAKKIGLKVNVYECPWARCVRAIENGDADIIDELFYSEDRNESIYFLKPHYAVQTAGFRFYADNSRIKKIKKWDDLKNLKIGMLRGYKHFPSFDNDKKLQKLDFLEVENIASLILKGRLDVFIAPPSFDENSFKSVDVENKLMKQPYSYVENLPLYLGISRKSLWFEQRETLENNLKEIIESKN